MQGFGGQSVSKEHKEGQSKIDCQRGGGGGGHKDITEP